MLRLLTLGVWVEAERVRQAEVETDLELGFFVMQETDAVIGKLVWLAALLTLDDAASSTCMSYEAMASSTSCVL